MHRFIKIDDWKIIEEGFDPRNQRASESIFALGNGWMGQRANFEEDYSGSSLKGHYLAGVYYPDKTRVGWWKVGYPEYFAKVINAPGWIGIRVMINDITLDLAQHKPDSFLRILHMKEGFLEREFTVTLPGGKQLIVNAKRFLSLRRPELGVIRYEVRNVNFTGTLTFVSTIDGDVKNEDANYNEKFWKPYEQGIFSDGGYLTMNTKKLGFGVCTGMRNHVMKNNRPVEANDIPASSEKYVGITYKMDMNAGDRVVIYKYAAQTTTMNYPHDRLVESCREIMDKAFSDGFEVLMKEQADTWAVKWKTSDIVIEGDPEAQQGIRFNIFHLNQTYTGEDERLNIGPKGFTGEKYGGSTYWDTEAFCFPFYLSTAASSNVARNLLLYRFKHLDKAVENATKLGFNNGAALYPMVTMNGEECHNEWEITFEEIHRNGAIAYAIFHYLHYTGDYDYLVDCGLEVLIAISRFWSQRVNWSAVKRKYVILGVTGPNEYENNVNNNWYTNTLASWCMEFTIECVGYTKRASPEKYDRLVQKISFDEASETALWRKIIDHMYYPVDEELGIFLQQEGYMDKEQMLASELSPAVRPLNQHWSWDRILRSCFIKQADVLQGLFFLEHRYDTETIRRNFDFYEPRTVHESSLSACVHSIIAARIGYEEKAYELYLRTARLDLDDYNREVKEGLHITSMAGTWMAIVYGFGGMRVNNGILSFHPMIPSRWTAYSFHVRQNGCLLNFRVNRDHISIENQSEITSRFKVYGKEYELKGEQSLEITN